MYWPWISQYPDRNHGQEPSEGRRERRFFWNG